MAYRLPPLPPLRSFEAASRHLSFKKAAAEMHVTPAAISQQVKALEEYLGVQLFVRLSRRLELSVEGEAMLPKLREAFECLAAAVEATRGSSGSLMIMAPPNFAARWLVPHLSRFACTHPEINFQLSSSLDAIDLQDASLALGATIVDPRKATIEVAIRFGAGRCPGHRVDFLLAPLYTLVCSPQLLSGKRPLRVPSDIRKHVLIHDEAIPGATLRPSWDEWIRVAGIANFDASNGLRFGNPSLALDAALNAQGVVLAPEPLVAAEVAAGRLVVPFDIKVSTRHFYYLATPEAVADRPEVAAFRDWLITEAAVPMAIKCLED